MTGYSLSEQELVDRILAHLRLSVLRGEAGRELTDTTPLLDYRLLNSIRTAELLVFVRDDLGISIDGLDLTGDTLATARDLGRALASQPPRLEVRPDGHGYPT